MVTIATRGVSAASSFCDSASQLRSHSLTMKLGSLVDDLGVPVLKHMESRASQVDEIRSIFAKEELVRANISGKVREFKLAVEDAVGRALDPTGSLALVSVATTIGPRLIISLRDASESASKTVVRGRSSRYSLPSGPFAVASVRLCTGSNG